MPVIAKLKTGTSRGEMKNLTSQKFIAYIDDGNTITVDGCRISSFLDEGKTVNGSKEPEGWKHVLSTRYRRRLRSLIDSHLAVSVMLKARG